MITDHIQNMRVAGCASTIFSFPFLLRGYYGIRCGFCVSHLTAIVTTPDPGTPVAARIVVCRYGCARSNFDTPVCIAWKHERCIDDRRRRRQPRCTPDGMSRDMVLSRRPCAGKRVSRKSAFLVLKARTTGRPGHLRYPQGAAANEFRPRCARTLTAQVHYLHPSVAQYLHTHPRTHIVHPQCSASWAA